MRFKHPIAALATSSGPDTPARRLVKGAHQQMERKAAESGRVVKPPIRFMGKRFDEEMGVWIYEFQAETLPNTDK